MTGGAVLAIDQGTSGTTAIVALPDGSIAGTAQVPVHPRPVGDGGVEQDPEQLWLSVVDAGRKALAASGVEVVGVALANQGETVLAWDRDTGRPRSDAVVWQDRRAETVCERLAAHAGEVEEITGLKLDSYFAAPKMTWLREQGVTGGVVTTSDAWLLHRLTGRFCTDAATASRTALLDLAAGDWSPRMGELFGLDVADQPEILPCDAVVGRTRAFGPELPVAGLAVDQQAALFGQGALAVGEAKCTYGTGAFLLVNTGSHPVRSSQGLVGCVAWRLADPAGHRDTYCLDGQVYTVGSAVDWLRRLGVIDSPADLDTYAAGAPDRGEVFVPALAGLAAPYWSPRARAALTGLTLGSDRRAICRAVLEGLAASVAVIVGGIAADLGHPLVSLRVDGGLTACHTLMQLQADLLQLPVEVSAVPEATALGVAALGRLAVGAVPDAASAVAPLQGERTVYEPRIPADQAADRLQRWRDAVDRVLAG